MKQVIYPDIRRVNLSIEGSLHDASCDYARRLDLTDGFSGLVSRLLIAALKAKRPSVATLPRRFSPIKRNGKAA